MATNEQVLKEVEALRSDVCRRVEGIEMTVQDHERRLNALEVALPLKLEHLAELLDEIKTNQGRWIKYGFLVVIILILVVAALAGVSKLPDMPILP